MHDLPFDPIFIPAIESMTIGLIISVPHTLRIFALHSVFLLDSFHLFADCCLLCLLGSFG